MHLITGQTISSTLFGAYRKLLDEGYHQPSHKSGCKSLYDVTMEVKNPRSRHLYLKGRHNDIFRTIAETFWNMAGSNKVSPYLSFYLPRIKDFSDDGFNMHGALGYRMHIWDQLSGALETFKTDGIYSRRVNITIQNPMDSHMGIMEFFEDDVRLKDYPPVQSLSFYVTHGNQFCCKVNMSSGDIIYDAGSTVPFVFSLVHEMMFNEMNRVFPDAGLELGAFRMNVTNLHMNDFNILQLEDATQWVWEDNDNNFVANSINAQNENNIPVIGPWIGYWKAFFNELLEVYTEAIEDETGRFAESMISHLGTTFIAYDVPIENNLLWVYARLLADYTASKKGTVALPTPTDISWCDMEVKQAIMNSGFRSFEVKDE